MFDTLCNYLTIENKRPEKIPTNFFKYKKIVITGSFSDLTRNELKLLLEKYGATVSGSVSNNTDFLIVGDNAGSKLDKAQKLGILIINESKLKDLLESVSILN